MTNKTPRLNDLVRIKIARNHWVDGTITYTAVGGTEDPNRKGFVSILWDNGDYSQHIYSSALTWDSEIEGWQF